MSINLKTHTIGMELNNIEFILGGPVNEIVTEDRTFYYRRLTVLSADGSRLVLTLSAGDPGKLDLLEVDNEYAG